MQSWNRAKSSYEAHDFIFIYWGRAEGDIGQPPWFTDIDAGFSYASSADHWNTHYSRCIENQLDTPHVPFVHATTIGRRSGTIIDGPWVKSMPFNKLVLLQDKRPVLTQRPKITSLRMGEKLIPADGSIIEYRRRRQQLIDAVMCK